MPSTMGSKARTIILNHESHKLHLEFQAAADITQGQPCKLNTSGQILPIAAGDAATIPVLGYAFHSGLSGQNVTLVVPGYLVLYCFSGAAIVPGFAKYSGQFVDSSSDPYKYNLVVQATDRTDMQGWVLDSAAGANGLVRFLVKP